MYKTYRIYVGRNSVISPDESLDLAMTEINERQEEIISVIPIAEGYHVLIVTKETDAS